MSLRKTALSAAIIVLLMIISSMPLGEEGEAVVITTFKDGSATKEKTFASAGTDENTFAFEVEGDANVTISALSVEGKDDGSGNCPRNLTLNLDGQGGPEYKFQGTGYGDFGHQHMFNTSDLMENIHFAQANDVAEVSLLLPKEATVTLAEVEAEGIGSLMIEDFEAGTGWPWSPWTGGSGGTVGTGSAHDGTYGITDPSWRYRTDLSLGYAGDTLSWWVRMGGTSGRAYLGFGATASGCWSFVVAPNTNTIIIQQNTGYTGYSDKASTPYASYTSNKWYKAVVEFVSTTSVIGRLYDTDGITQLAMVQYASVTGLPGGVAMRSFSTFHLDSIESGGGPGPQDPELDVGKTGGTPDWTKSGTFDTQVKITGLATAINGYLQSHPADFEDGYGNQIVQVPMEFTSATKGRIKLWNLSVAYDYKAAVFKHPGPGNLTSEILKILQNSGAGSQNVTIKIHVTTDSPGKVILSYLLIGYDDAPVWLPLANLQVPEDTLMENTVDLSILVFDDIDDPVDLTYTVVSNSLAEHVGVYISEDHYLTLDATVEKNWNSESGDGGLAEVVLEVTDSGNHTARSALFTVEVTPVNDEPVPQEELPDIVMEEGEKKDTVMLSSRQYFTDVEYDMLHYDVMVDPLEVYDGEEGNLTAAVNPINNVLELTAHNDFFTGEGPAIPVWVFCDDDAQVNTIADGYYEGGRHNWTFQEVNVTVVNVNDAPVWADLPKLELEEDGELPDVLDLRDYIFDIDTDIEDIEFKVKKNSNKRIRVTLDDKGVLSVTPQADQSGTATIEVEADDGTDEASTTFKVTVTPVNDLPVIKLTSHTDDQSVQGMVEFLGTSTDTEGPVQAVNVLILPAGELEALIGGGTPPAQVPWALAEGTNPWAYRWDTTAKGVKNGDYTVTVRAFDGTDYSENVTISLKVENPINLRPEVRITYPYLNDTLWGEMVISGTSGDDAAVTTVELSIGNNVSWKQVDNGSFAGFISWSHPTNISQYSEGNLTIFARSFDGEKYSEEASVNVVVEAPFVPEEEHIEPEGTSKDDSFPWWIIILIIAIVVAVLVVALYMRSKKQREMEEEEERQRLEEEEKEAARKAAAISAQLSFATGPALAGSPFAGGYAPAAPPPLPPPPPAVVGALPPSPPPAGAGDMLLLQAAPAAPAGAPPPPPPPPGAPVAAPGAPPPPPPPPGAPPAASAAAPGTLPPAAAAAAPAAAVAAPAAAAPMAAPPPAPAGGETTVGCFSCGTPIPVTPTGGLQKIRCPSCGTEGEIGG